MMRRVVSALTLTLPLGRPSDAMDASTSSHADGPRAGVPEQLRFTATTLDGTEFSGERLAGKPAVLWF